MRDVRFEANASFLNSFSPTKPLTLQGRNVPTLYFTAKSSEPIWLYWTHLSYFDTRSFGYNSRDLGDERVDYIVDDNQEP